MTRFPLTDGWTLQLSRADAKTPPELPRSELPARIPGCVHTDLLAAGLLPDPYWAQNEKEQHWIGRSEWTYRCRFEAPPGLERAERVELRCDGLDTVASLTLNGQPLGSAESMHLRQRYPVKELLRAGPNELRITFASAPEYAQAQAKRLGALPASFPQPYNFVRKMACNFGWDWGPILITAGVWQPVFLEAWDGVRIEAVRPLVLRADEDRARIEVHADLDGAPQAGASCRFELTAPNGTILHTQTAIPPGAARVAGVLEVERPERWWPQGHGAQPLYELRVRLQDGQGAELDVWRGRIGLRTVELDTTPDRIGSAFTLRVNGKPVFCKGANWIPDDCFPARVSRERYAQRISQALDANMNMLRVWGGGRYESRDFYELCDERGMLVWQDFLFACAMYPEEPPFGALVEAEARQQVARLSQHPSLVLWNGNNENIWGYFDWGWKKKVENRSWGLGYYLELLPRVVRELDPTRPYWPGSPYSGSMEIKPLADEHGNKHVWDAWNQVDYSVYRKYTPRFVSEFGHQAPPTYAALAQAIPPEEWQSASPAMLHHQKASEGNKKLHARLAEHFEIPQNFDDWLYCTQLNQARAMSCGVEWFRSRFPVCMGTLYWQLNDCWPVTSWAAIDGAGKPKLLWYASRRFFAPRLLTLQPEGETLAVFLHNDHDEAWQGTLALRRMDFQGEVLASQTLQAAVPPRQILRLPLEPRLACPRDPQAELLAAERSGPQPLRACWYFEIDRRLRYPAPDFEAHYSRDGNRHRLIIKARRLLREIALFPDRLDHRAQLNEQLVTLLPGEEFAFEFESALAFDAQRLSARPYLQCANFYGAGQG